MLDQFWAAIVGRMETKEFSTLGDYLHKDTRIDETCMGKWI